MGWEVHKSRIWHLSTYSMDATFRSNVYCGWHWVCCMDMQNRVRSDFASSIIAGLKIGRSDVCVLAFYFTENSYMRIHFLNTICDKTSLCLTDRVDRITLMQCVKLHICKDSCFFSSIRANNQSSYLYINKTWYLSSVILTQFGQPSGKQRLKWVRKLSILMRNSKHLP